MFDGSAATDGTGAVSGGALWGTSVLENHLNGLELSPAHMWLAAGAASVVAATVAVATRVHQLRQRGRLCCMAFRLRDWGNRTVRRTARLKVRQLLGAAFQPRGGRTTQRSPAEFRQRDRACITWPGDARPRGRRQQWNVIPLLVSATDPTNGPRLLTVACGPGPYGMQPRSAGPGGRGVSPLSIG